MRIRTVDLTKTYRVGLADICAVNKVNLEVDGAEFIAVVGPSGSGKSTLLNLVGLNDVPTSGKIFVDEADASGFSGGRRRRFRLLRMGFVFQTFNLFPTLNAVENVELPLALAHKPRMDQRERAVKLLETVGLGDRIFHIPRELSMGEMQRVAIARALANNPEIVIADEPTGELDSVTAGEIISLLSNISKKEERTVIVATHDEKVVDVADTVYRIQDGRLTAQN
jgi:putative ABC transport system ATP-binding protein